MYDKYNKISYFTTGSTNLPAHKGIMFSILGAGTSGSASMVVANASGGTSAIDIKILGTSPSIVPFSTLYVTGMTGVTGWLLN